MSSNLGGAVQQIPMKIISSLLLPFLAIKGVPMCHLIANEKASILVKLEPGLSLTVYSPYQDDHRQELW